MAEQLTPEQLEQKVIEEFNAAKRIQQGEDADVNDEGAPETPAAPEQAAPEAPKPTPGEPYQLKNGEWNVDIDLGDGAGVQKFKDSTLKGLISKLAKAQHHASLKIRDLNKRLKEGPVTPEAAKPEEKLEARPLTADEQWLISQELQTDPAGALAKLFKATVGADPDELRQALQDAREIKAQQQRASVANDFVAAHPEYVGSPANEKLMLEYIAKNNLAFTLKNLEIAFDELVEAGLVTTKNPSAAAPVTPATPEQSSVRTRKRGASVGIFSSSASANDDEDAKPNTLSVDAMLKLSEDERERIVLREFSKGR